MRMNRAAVLEGSLTLSYRSNQNMSRGIKNLRIRDRVRLYGVPVAARLGHHLGLSWEQLGETLGREVLIGQVRELDHSSNGARAGESLDIVFATFQGMNQHVLSVDVVLARALQARGHSVQFVLCDQVLPLCQSKHADWKPRWESMCSQCFGFGLRILEQAGFEVLKFSELMDESVRTTDEWNEYVESSLLKHYRVGTLQENSEVAERREGFKRTAAISASVGRRLAQMKPDRVIMSHGLYCTWGPAREELLRAGIPVVTSGPGKKKDTITLNWSVSNDSWDVSNEWARVKDNPLTPDQERVLDSYLQSRRSHGSDIRVYNFGSEEAVEETKTRLRLDPNKQTFTLFTNVLWDAASAQREISFSDPINWAIETIRWFADHPEKQLVVKIHPAEVVIGTKQPFMSEIERRLPSIPPNVRLIAPSEKVNSWSILKVTDLGLVHTSTVGLELPLEGVPCVVVSRTHYRGKGFTVDAESRDDYFSILETWDPSRVDISEMRERARRYAYLMFERYQLPFSFTHEPRPFDVRALRHASTEEILADPSIQVIVEGLENQSELLMPA